MLLKGTYEIIEPLSTQVSLAYHRKTKQRVAIRELSLQNIGSWSAIERIEAESLLLRSIKHSAVPRSIDFFILDETSPDPRFFLVREYIEAKPLFQRTPTRFSLEELFSLGSRIFELLSELHQLSPPLLHGALTPESFLEKEDGSLVLLGFGNASFPEQFSLSEFAAPEREDEPASIGSDLYSVGAILYQMASGLSPDDLPRIDGAPQFAQNLSPKLTKTLSLLLHSNPKKRPASAKEARRFWRNNFLQETALAFPRERALLSQKTKAKNVIGAGALLALFGTALAVSSPGLALLLLPTVVVSLYLSLRIENKKEHKNTQVNNK